MTQSQKPKTIMIIFVHLVVYYFYNFVSAVYTTLYIVDHGCML